MRFCISDIAYLAAGLKRKNAIYLLNFSFSPQILNTSSYYDKVLLLPPLDWYRKGVNSMEVFITFLVAVAAGVVCHYVIKWLDGDK